MLLHTALTLASRGLHVFPCQPRDKRPATKNGLLDATTELETIRQWWRQEPQLNVAIATGRSSKIFVVDIDGPDAEGELCKLEAQHGEIWPTVESITARGRHLFFRWPDRMVRNSAGRIAPGIDVRGEGGYVLAPPSIHPSGRAYAWSVDSANAFAAAPDWLLARITPTSNGAPAPATEWRALVRGGVEEGQRNQSVTRLAGYLLRRHLDAIVVLEMLTAWNAARCRPPLDVDEVTTIVDSIAARELKRRGAS